MNWDDSAILDAFNASIKNHRIQQVGLEFIVSNCGARLYYKQLILLLLLYSCTIEGAGKWKARLRYETWIFCNLKTSNIICNKLNPTH